MQDASAKEKDVKLSQMWRQIKVDLGSLNSTESPHVHKISIDFSSFSSGKGGFQELKATETVLSRIRQMNLLDACLGHQSLNQIINFDLAHIPNLEGKFKDQSGMDNPMRVVKFGALLSRRFQKQSFIEVVDGKRNKNTEALSKHKQAYMQNLLKGINDNVGDTQEKAYWDFI